jgi:hypothetical protein
VKQLTSTIITLHNFLMPSPESAVPYIPANLVDVDVDVDVEDKATGIVCTSWLACGVLRLRHLHGFLTNLVAATTTVQIQEP